MPQDENQVNTGEQQNMAQQGHGLSDDELAAALGFITTISEGYMPKANPVDELSKMKTEDEGDTKNYDEEQDKEIADIRAELEALKAEPDHDQE